VLELEREARIAELILEQILRKVKIDPKNVAEDVRRWTI